MLTSVPREHRCELAFVMTRRPLSRTAEVANGLTSFIIEKGIIAAPEQCPDQRADQTTQQNSEDTAVDKDRIKGSAEQAKGPVKEAAGRILGDNKLETDGKADKAAGRVQNAIGGLKDAVRGS